jgi:hypothetical protein
MGIAIFDLDGCLSNDSHRLGLLPDVKNVTSGDEYAAYNDMCALDKPCNQIEWTKAQAGLAVIVVTARPEVYRAHTLQWIRKNLGGRFQVLMRPDGDLRHSPELKIALLEKAGIRASDITVAYDDRPDVLRAYAKFGIHNLWLMNCSSKTKFAAKRRDAGDILAEMAATYKERNAVYGDNYKMVAKLMKVLFPNGVPPELVVQDHFHLFELKLVKLSRFAISNLTHQDSIRDDGVYSAMIEAIITEGQ